MNVRWRSLALSLLVPVGISAIVISSVAADPLLTKHGKADLAQLPAMPHALPIPLEHATPVHLPKPTAPLKPVPFTATPKLKGWVIEIPGNHPICTPAYASGKLYVGGGYGAHEFYCFDAPTGKLLWTYNTSDDGPTAAVVEEGCVAFNTESCTVYVLDANTGKELWKEWLGDPLMSQPAISKGHLFMAYPSGQHGGKPGHALLCADLRTGKHIWNEQISADVISAPIVEYDRVYLTCMDGTSYCFSARDGSLIWKKQGAATSAPVIHDGRLIVSERQGEGKQVCEGIRRVDAGKGAADGALVAAAPAPYIYGGSNGTIGPQSGDLNSIAVAAKAHGGGAGAAKAHWFQAMDSAVGFPAAPPPAQMDLVQQNLGIGSVSGAWGYQGARAAYNRGNVTNAQLTYVNCVDAITGQVKWRAEAKGSFITGQSQVFSTPSLGRKNIYLCSGDGHVVCMDQATGTVNYMLATQKPISFQPALANRSIYLGTADGSLVCLDTDDPDADGWTSWGGNAQHNKTD
jgi:outer membrane protein assembly factor BamB